MMPGGTTGDIPRPTLNCVSCHQCGLETPEDLIQHCQKKHLIDQKKYPCTICGLVAYSGFKRLRHHTTRKCWGPDWKDAWKNSNSPRVKDDPAVKNCSHMPQSSLHHGSTGIIASDRKARITVSHNTNQTLSDRNSTGNTTISSVVTCSPHTKKLRAKLLSPPDNSGDLKVDPRCDFHLTDSDTTTTKISRNKSPVCRSGTSRSMRSTDNIPVDNPTDSSSTRRRKSRFLDVKKNLFPRDNISRTVNGSSATNSEKCDTNTRQENADVENIPSSCKENSKLTNGHVVSKKRRLDPLHLDLGSPPSKVRKFDSNRIHSNSHEKVDTDCDVNLTKSSTTIIPVGSNCAIVDWDSFIRLPSKKSRSSDCKLLINQTTPVVSDNKHSPIQFEDQPKATNHLIKNRSTNSITKTDSPNGRKSNPLPQLPRRSSKRNLNRSKNAYSPPESDQIESNVGHTTLQQSPHASTKTTSKEVKLTTNSYQAPKTDQVVSDVAADTQPGELICIDSGDICINSPSLSIHQQPSPSHSTRPDAPITNRLSSLIIDDVKATNTSPIPSNDSPLVDIFQSLETITSKQALSFDSPGPSLRSSKASLRKLPSRSDSKPVSLPQRKSLANRRKSRTVSICSDQTVATQSSDRTVPSTRQLDDQQNSEFDPAPSSENDLMSQPISPLLSPGASTTATEPLTSPPYQSPTPPNDASLPVGSPRPSDSVPILPDLFTDIPPLQPSSSQQQSETTIDLETTLASCPVTTTADMKILDDTATTVSFFDDDHGTMTSPTTKPRSRQTRQQTNSSALLEEETISQTPDPDSDSAKTETMLPFTETPIESSIVAPTDNPVALSDCPTSPLPKTSSHSTILEVVADSNTLPSPTVEESIDPCPSSEHTNARSAIGETDNPEAPSNTGDRSSTGTKLSPVRTRRRSYLVPDDFDDVIVVGDGDKHSAVCDDESKATVITTDQPSSVVEPSPRVDLKPRRSRLQILTDDDVIFVKHDQATTASDSTDDTSISNRSSRSRTSSLQIRNRSSSLSSTSTTQGQIRQGRSSSSRDASRSSSASTLTSKTDKIEASSTTSSNTKTSSGDCNPPQGVKPIVKQQRKKDISSALPKPALRNSLGGKSDRRPAHYTCPGCSTMHNGFDSLHALIDHLLSLKPSTHKSTIVGSQWPSPLSSLATPHLSFGCNICGAMFASESRLDKHKQSSHSQWLAFDRQRQQSSTTNSGYGRRLSARKASSSN